MTTFENLHWESLRLVKRHLYRRLATPLNNALGRLAIARHVTDPAEAREQYRRVEYNVEIALNLVKAWAALVHVMGGGVIRQSQRRQITPASLPDWLAEHLKTQTTVQVEHTLPVVVHPETFYESLLLMCLIAAEAGTLTRLVTGDAPNDDTTIWIRASFEPPPSGPFTSLGAIYRRFNTSLPAEQELMFQLQALQEFCRINGATLRLQNNKRTGEQALAVSLPVGVRSSVSTAAPAQAAVDETQEATVAHLLRGLASQPANGSRAAAGEIENHPQTHILPSLAIQPAPAAPENLSDTLIVPPPDFRKRLVEQLDAESKPDAPALEARRFGTGPFDRPPSPGVIEVVEPENASDTLIVPPPDYQRRLGLSRSMSKPRSRYPGSRPSEKSEEQDKPASGD